MSLILRKPSAFVPVIMSFVAFALVLIHLALFGATRQADAGVAAHMWQILMLGQIPILVFFVLRWMPKAPRVSLMMIGLQLVAALAAIAPVYFLRL